MWQADPQRQEVEDLGTEAGPEEQRAELAGQAARAEPAGQGGKKGKREKGSMVVPVGKGAMAELARGIDLTVASQIHGDVVRKSKSDQLLS
ncbi:hypothetical protein Q8A67_022415 [Cirrhinus molitorella]|uniref:Uncharacterized protein n=1 Tax=Cirrhinus molitorella TaxID=172907 RepID=A0AA88P6I9_9TELE|nr:hypothetical protein Q8A67_022415 [Cirrhinus molitorella]